MLRSQLYHAFFPLSVLMGIMAKMIVMMIIIHDYDDDEDEDSSGVTRSMSFGG